MASLNRFMSRKEKDGSSHRREKSRDKSKDRKAKNTSSDGLTSLFKSDREKKREALNHLIQEIKDRMQTDHGYNDISDEEANWALSSMYADGNKEKAFEYLVLFRRSAEGKIVRYNPAVHMLGAENRGNVTCYIDTVLFAMFDRRNFEHLLCQPFEDEPTKRLATLTRFWVNLLRSGKLINTDVTLELQKALADCGWPHNLDRQQDASELYNFITDKFRLPLLTLKVDIYHHGAENATDDHKIIHERMLAVAVPERSDPNQKIKLEDCLENYLNNRVEVFRSLERSDTKSSAWSIDSSSDTKGGALHIEAVEVPWSVAQSPVSDQTPSSSLPRDLTRHRTTSIIRHRVLRDDEKSDSPSDANEGGERIRKEVAMPAWQFFTIRTGQTKDFPKSDAEVAAHFSQKKPVLAICLKRYGMTSSGEPVKNDTYIDIPLDIALPYFIEDESQDSPLAGNFKLSLQSVICHMGTSLDSGHYITYSRRPNPVAERDSASHQTVSSTDHPPEYPEDQWVRFDDVNDRERVTVADVHAALKDAYLLSYQIIPLFEDSHSETSDALPPSYDSGIYMEASHASTESDSEDRFLRPASYFDGATNLDIAPKIRFSAEIERPRSSLNLPEERRGSLPHTGISISSTASSMKTPGAVSAPATPSEETTVQRMSRAAARFTKSGNKSRPPSSSGENRLSATFSKLNMMKSKDQLSKIDLAKQGPGNGDDKDGPHSASRSVDSVVTGKPQDEPKIQRSKSKKQKEKNQAPLDKAQHDQQSRAFPRNLIRRWPTPERQCSGM